MINGALNLLPGAVNQPRPTQLLMQVSAVQPLPQTFDDPLYVVQPHQPDGYLQILRWPACHGNTLPTAGTWCLVELDNYGNAWCVQWLGTHSTPPVPFANRLATFMLANPGLPSLAPTGD